MALEILVLGAGALGSLVGAYLSENHNVALYGRPHHSEAIQNKGLTIKGVNGQNTFYGLEALCAPSQLVKRSFDLVLLGVKAYDTEKALNLLNQTEFRFISSIQNGLKDDPLIARYGEEKVLGCVVDEAAFFSSPGSINYTNKGATYFGSFSINEKEKLEVAKTLIETLTNKVGYTELTNDMNIVTWYKFMTIVPVFGVQGSLNVNAAQMVENSAWRIFFKELVRETREVTIKKGIVLRPHRMLKPYYLTPSKINRLCGEAYASLSILPSAPVSSLLQDLRRGKHITEADYTIGKLIQIAESLGVDVTMTRTVYASIKRVEFMNHLKIPQVPCPICTGLQ